MVPSYGHITQHYFHVQFTSTLMHVTGRWNAYNHQFHCVIKQQGKISRHSEIAIEDCFFPLRSLQQTAASFPMWQCPSVPSVIAVCSRTFTSRRTVWPHWQCRGCKNCDKRIKTKMTWKQCRHALVLNVTCTVAAESKGSSDKNKQFWSREAKC